MRLHSLLAAAVCALALIVPSTALAAEPPNPNDPCSEAGRNTCGTNGVGQYATYRYGVRWFGDFRGAVPGERQTFCIDLRFWYPSRAHRYEETSPQGLRNRDGRAVSVKRQRMMAYALWAYGRSGSKNQQGAVMLFVHQMMGDGRAGEVDPAAVNPTVASIYRRIARDAARFHGPYRVQLRLSDDLRVGRVGTATVRVLSATGRAVPGVRLELSGTGVSGLARTTTTGASGVARVRFTAASADGARISVRTGTLPSTLPRLYAATTRAASANAQRLAAPASQRLTARASAPVERSTIAVRTTATPSSLLVGEQVRDTVRISGAASSWRQTVTVRLHGPFRSREAITCDAAPVWEGTFRGSGSGTTRTAPVRLDRPGYYTYQLVVPGDASHDGLTTPCGEESETVRVEVQPRVRTEVSQLRVAPGSEITDLVIVSGLAGEPAVVTAELFGPFGSRSAITCDGAPLWSGEIPVTADGEFRTEPTTLTVAGYYTYRERIAADGFVRAAETACGEAAETTIAFGQPTIRTQVSEQETTPGSTITDEAVVSGLGALSVPVKIELWGPFASPDAIVCTGEPYWTGTFTADGDGTYTTEPVELDRAGYYTYREQILPDEATDGFVGVCGEASETTVARATPSITTRVSSEVVRPGARIADRITLDGLGATPVTLDVEVFGPFASRAAIRCTGTPISRTRKAANGDGVVRSADVRVPRVGFYAYRLRLPGTPLIDAVTTECGIVDETALAAPGIATGRGDVATYVRAPRAGGRTPTRVSVPALGIDAPVSSVAIDLPNGVLGVPTDVARTGWWRDGALPGDAKGAVLIAGHVDSARQGSGAFFRLKDARRGVRIRVRTADGRTRSYRVTSVRTMRKSRLPLSVWSRKGDGRLVLVTCGGPFVPSVGHYRDNVVVTAVPV